MRDLSGEDREILSTHIGRMVASMGSRHQTANGDAIRASMSQLVERMEAKYGPEPALMALRGKFIGNHLAGSHVDRACLGGSVEEL